MYAVSRHPLDYDVKRAKHIRLDLSDKDAVKQVCTGRCRHAREPILYSFVSTIERNGFARPAGPEG